MSEEDPLAGKGDQLAGRGKEAVGGVTGDTDLEAEGKGQQAEGKLEEGIEGVKDKLRDLTEGDRS